MPQALRWAVEEGAIRHEAVTAVMACGYIAQHNAEPNHPFNPDYHEADARAALTELVQRAVGTESGVTRELVSTSRPARAPRGGQWCDVARRRREGCRRIRGIAARLRERSAHAPRSTLHAPCPVVVLPAGEG